MDTKGMYTLPKKYTNGKEILIPYRFTTKKVPSI